MLKPFLKFSLLFSAVVFFVIAVASMPAPTLAAGHMPQAAGSDSTNPVKSTAVSQEKAKKMYAVDCAVCHGETGNGKTDLGTDMKVPDWTDPKTLAGKSDQELFDIIRKGKDKMPPEDAGRAKDAEVWGLVTYIRTLTKDNAAAPAAPAAPDAQPAPVAPPAPTN
jgi:mono/diheme cytochrome c family protein